MSVSGIQGGMFLACVRGDACDPSCKNAMCCAVQATVHPNGTWTMSTLQPPVLA